MILYDSDQPDQIPVGVPAVAGYADGEPGTWSQSDWERFVGLPAIRISRRADVDADVLDVETGAASPGDIGGWLLRHKGPRLGVVYCSRAVQPDAIAELGDTALPYWWLADWNGLPHLLPGTVATQYASPTVPAWSGMGHYDLSEADPNWLATFGPSSPLPAPIHYADGVQAVSGRVTISQGVGWADKNGVPGWSGERPISVVLDQTDPEQLGVPHFTGWSADGRLWFAGTSDGGPFGFTVWEVTQ